MTALGYYIQPHRCDYRHDPCAAAIHGTAGVQRADWYPEELDACRRLARSTSATRYVHERLQTPQTSVWHCGGVFPAGTTGGNSAAGLHQWRFAWLSDGRLFHSLVSGTGAGGRLAAFDHQQPDHLRRHYSTGDSAGNSWCTGTAWQPVFLPVQLNQNSVSAADGRACCGARCGHAADVCAI
uniref:Sialidase domain-containing protein n=1 Tax=Parastrongyloides trichosuri TaxID=131310 RepID=A0A0N4ZDW3_PARTI